MIVEKHSRMPRKFDPEDVKPVEKLEVAASLRDVDPKILLHRYLSDESTKDIAATYGVTRQALGQYLLRHAEEDWKEAQVMRAIARKEKAEDELEIAKDPMTLARARELLKAAQWDLERVCRRIYGEDKQTVQVVTPVLNITISSTNEEAKAPGSISISLPHAQDRLVDVQPQQSGAAIEDTDCHADVVPVQSGT